jgi:hypothetical protein
MLHFTTGACSYTSARVPDPAHGLVFWAGSKSMEWTLEGERKVASQIETRLRTQAAALELFAGGSPLAPMRWRTEELLQIARRMHALADELDAYLTRPCPNLV